MSSGYVQQSAEQLYQSGLYKEAVQKAYLRLIEEYPGQKQEVAVAKERLARLTKTLEKVPHKPTFRKIRIPANPGNGVLSPEYLQYDI